MRESILKALKAGMRTVMSVAVEKGYVLSMVEVDCGEMGENRYVAGRGRAVGSSR